MFTRKTEKDQSPLELGRGVVPPPPPASQPAAATQAIPRPAGRSQPSVIGADLTIIGNLVSKGEVHVEGEVQGDLHAAQITVGESATITGGLVADEIVVRGSISGSLRGRRVVLQSSSRVEGDIYHQQLGIEQGAFFEGKSRRLEEAPSMPDPAVAAQRNGTVSPFPSLLAPNVVPAPNGQDR